MSCSPSPASLRHARRGHRHPRKPVLAQGVRRFLRAGRPSSDGGFDFPSAIERALNDKDQAHPHSAPRVNCPRPTISVDAIGEAVVFCKKAAPRCCHHGRQLLRRICRSKRAERLRRGYDRRQSHQESRRRSCPPSAATSAARRQCVDRRAYRLSAPGLGQEVGKTWSHARAVSGFPLAPNVVSGAVKGRCVCRGVL